MYCSPGRGRKDCCIFSPAGGGRVGIVTGGEVRSWGKGQEKRDTYSR